MRQRAGFIATSAWTHCTAVVDKNGKVFFAPVLASSTDPSLKVFFAPVLAPGRFLRQCVFCDGGDFGVTEGFLPKEV